MGSSGYYQVEGQQQFANARRRAQICRWCKKLMKRPLTLLPFAPIHSRLPYPNGIHRGTQEIPVAQIVGSLGRANEFDRFFRPLLESQRERWITMWVQQMRSGWEPILVHQIGNLYFVEDGHHRTSVARTLGLTAIAANVTEYPLLLKFNANASLETILAQLEGILTDADDLVAAA